MFPPKFRIRVFIKRLPKAQEASGSALFKRERLARPFRNAGFVDINVFTMLRVISVPGDYAMMDDG